VLTAADWHYGQDPCGVIREGWNRQIRKAARCAPSGMEIHLSLAPWSALLESVSEEVRRADEFKLAVTIDAGMCAIVEMQTLRAKWGDTAAGVVTAALRTGLGRVINVWDPVDLEWIPEWWQDSLEMYGDEEDDKERKAEEKRIQDFAASKDYVHASYFRQTTRTELVEALKSVPKGPVRWSAAALLSEKRQPRTLWPSKSWERTKSTEDGYPTAAVLITRTANDAVRHAYDEMQEQSMNSGYYSSEHGLILIDTSSQARLAQSLRQLQRVLRTLAWGEHLVHAIFELQDP
jgi:hypothetical protein